MYMSRLRTLKRAYQNAERSNTAYREATSNIAKYRSQLQYIRGLGQSLKILDALIAECESEWRESVLRMLEAEIAQDLAFIYPSDGYNVFLTSRVLRGKVHIEGYARSYYGGDMNGDLADSQGRLFQQVVSFGALVCIMKILGVETVYVDEAFSGASNRNVEKINRLLQDIKERGLNIILIAQDITMARNIDANVLLLSRSLDNKTSIVQTGGL